MGRSALQGSRRCSPQSVSFGLDSLSCFWECQALVASAADGLASLVQLKQAHSSAGFEVQRPPSVRSKLALRQSTSLDPIVGPSALPVLSTTCLPSVGLQFSSSTCGGQLSESRHLRTPLKGKAQGPRGYAASSGRFQG